MKQDFLNKVSTWRDDEQEIELTQVRVGSAAKPRDFIDRSRGISFRIHTADHPHDFFSPRHQHTFDQVRYMIGGRVCFSDEPGQVYGDTTLRYIPPKVHYGSTECLEEATIVIVRWAPDGQTYAPSFTL